MSLPAKELNEYSSRLATFTTPHHLGKRRASAQSKAKKGNTVVWPHESPSPESLARAGFFYKPGHDSVDNVCCFTCTVKLDGWEASDDPISEHLAHSTYCAYATAISVMRDEDIPAQRDQPEQRDPLSQEMASARHATFLSGDGWPHEDKKGWKCKVNKMVEAGWAWDPNDEGDDRDGVTCFYCMLSLDGWEPKDDPFVEHQRRAPDCRFFALLEHYHGAEQANGKAKKAKGRGKASARNSTASKASRLSVQSVVSTMSEVPSMAGSLADVGTDASLAGVDDSIVTAATTASQATTTGVAKGKKKAAKPKAAAKGTKGKKKAPVEDAMEVDYPELKQPEQPTEDEEWITAQPPPTKATRKATRVVSKQLDSSVIEISQMDIAPPKKTTRGRKPKAKPQPEPEPEPEQIPEPTVEPEEIPQTPDVEAIIEKRLSDVSAQLQEELDDTVDEANPLDQSTPIADTTKPTRGVKRTSDGTRKEQSLDSSVVEVVSAKAKGQGKPGRKPKQVSAASADAEMEDSITVWNKDTHMGVDDEADELDGPDPEPAPKKARGRPKGSKNSSGRSSRSSYATATTEAEVQPEKVEEDRMDVDVDELEAPEPEVAPKKRGRPRGSKNKSSSARSSLASRASARPSGSVLQPHTVESSQAGLQPESVESPPTQQEGSQPDEAFVEETQAEEHELQDPEGLIRDEFEIEHELERIATEQASHDPMETEQDQVDEFETSPSQGRLSKDSEEIQRLEKEIQAEDALLSKSGAEIQPLEEDMQMDDDDNENAENNAPEADSPPRLSLRLEANQAFTFSPTGSDKENQPSSIIRAPSTVKPQPPIFLSPTKTTRIPLAPGTPNRSPTRMLMVSPSKAQIAAIRTTVPWEPIDLDTVFHASPHRTPGRVGRELAEAGGVLSSAEKRMTLEEWIYWRADKSAEELKRHCEGVVQAFEKEGLRNLEVLGGIVVEG